MMNTRQRPRERGAVTLATVMIILVVLLAGTVVALHIQLADTRSAGLARQGHEAEFCAEAGLAAARDTVATNYTSWNTVLAGHGAAWYPITGDLDGDGTIDYTVTIGDNDDELPPLTNDLTKDNDLRVFMSSTCNKFPASPRTVLELVSVQPASDGYRTQQGLGAGNSGNSN